MPEPDPRDLEKEFLDRTKWEDGTPMCMLKRALNGTLFEIVQGAPNQYTCVITFVGQPRHGPTFPTLEEAQRDGWNRYVALREELYRRTPPASG